MAQTSALARVDAVSSSEAARAEQRARLRHYLSSERVFGHTRSAAYSLGLRFGAPRAVGCDPGAAVEHLSR